MILKSYENKIPLKVVSHWLSSTYVGGGGAPQP